MRYPVHTWLTGEFERSLRRPRGDREPIRGLLSRVRDRDLDGDLEPAVGEKDPLWPLLFLAGGGDLEAAGEKEPLRSLLFRAGGDLEAALGPGEKDPPRRPRLLFRAGGGDLEPAPGEKEPCRPNLLLRLFLAGGDLINRVKNKMLINTLISFYVQF